MSLGADIEPSANRPTAEVPRSGSTLPRSYSRSRPVHAPGQPGHLCRSNPSRLQAHWTPCESDDSGSTRG